MSKWDRKCFDEKMKGVTGPKNVISISTDASYQWAFDNAQKLEIKRAAYVACKAYAMKKVHEKYGCIGTFVLSAVVGWVVWRVLNYIFDDLIGWKAYALSVS